MKKLEPWRRILAGFVAYSTPCAMALALDPTTVIQSFAALLYAISAIFGAAFLAVSAVTGACPEIGSTR